MMEMKFASRFLVVGAALFFTEAVLTAGGAFSLFSGSWGSAIVNTDMTREGRMLALPTPEAPVYYLGQSLGCRLGSIPGERLPDDKELTQIVVDALAKQGYLGATKGGHEPSLFLILQWGELQPTRDDLLWFLGYDPRQDIAAPSGSGRLGPEVFLRNCRSPEVDRILSYANKPIYGIIVTAFEYKSAKTDHPVAYWQTRIALPSNGKSMANAMPVMVMSAGPVFGRETGKAMLRDTNEARQGHVTLGELEVLDYYEDAAPVEKPAAPAKPSGQK
jgi:hypothetical protein